MPISRRLLALLAGAAVAGAALTLVTGPHRPALTTATGDTALVADVRAAVPDDRGFQTLSAARLRDGAVSYAGFGSAHADRPTPETPFELGSITKTFTGSLLADGVRRGELTYADPLSTHLPELADTAVGEATLEQLATHTAGLPPFPDSQALGVAARVIGNQNVYAGSAAELIEASTTTAVSGRGEYAYSNLGMALLGHAEARAADRPDWVTLARERITEPLGMTSTTFALSPTPAPGTPGPHQINGWRAAYSYGEAFAPAGSSTWTTAEDLMRYAQALMADEVPGMAALERRVDLPRGATIGLAWHNTPVESRTITWHNGGTGGYRTIVGLDRERGQAVVLLSNSTRDADRAGLVLAATPPGAPVPATDGVDVDWRSQLVWPAVGLVLLISFAVGAGRARDRLAVATSLITGVAGLVLLLARSPWHLAPGWIWGALAGASLVWAVASIRRARALPALPSRRVTGWLSLVSALLSLAFAGWVL